MVVTIAWSNRVTRLEQQPAAAGVELAGDVVEQQQRLLAALAR